MAPLEVTWSNKRWGQATPPDARPRPCVAPPGRQSGIKVRVLFGSQYYFSLSVLFLGPLVCLLVCFMLPQGSVKLSLFFLNSFFWFVFSVQLGISTALSSSSLILSSTSPNLLLIPSGVFFYSVIVFLSCLVLLYIF